MAPTAQDKVSAAWRPSELGSVAAPRGHAFVHQAQASPFLPPAGFVLSALSLWSFLPPSSPASSSSPGSPQPDLLGSPCQWGLSGAWGSPPSPDCTAGQFCPPEGTGSCLGVSDSCMIVNVHPPWATTIGTGFWSQPHFSDCETEAQWGLSGRAGIGTLKVQFQSPQAGPLVPTSREKRDRVAPQLGGVSGHQGTGGTGPETPTTAPERSLVPEATPPFLSPRHPLCHRDTDASPGLPDQPQAALSCPSRFHFSFS
jgi:hypothetical protein